jgi:hypothetical protein
MFDRMMSHCMGMGIAVLAAWLRSEASLQGEDRLQVVGHWMWKSSSV